jgi:hypothetical protein
MVTLKIKENSKQAKAFLELAKTLPFVEVLSAPEKSPYNKKFVEKIKKREKNAQGKILTRLNPNDVWGSIL